MRIAQVSPLYESVPPELYGGTERVVAYLTQELVGLGHDVTLFASGDSKTDARLIAPVERAVQGVKRIPQIERKACRRAFESRFTSSRMASDYEVIYSGCFRLSGKKPAPFFGATL